MCCSSTWLQCWARAGSRPRRTTAHPRSSFGFSRRSVFSCRRRSWSSSFPRAFPEEGGLYAWSKDAFGDFHGFVAGWTYWIYSVFYFPALLMASTAMSAYVVGPRGAELAQNRTFLLIGSFLLLGVAVVLNIVGLNIGKWLQNAGGVGTYLPLLILLGVAVAHLAAARIGRAIHLVEHPASLGLGHREFLAAVGVCLHGP